jgi:competence protein ComEA
MTKLLLLSALFSVNAFATPVNINSADAKTISESLAGISLKKAEAIVADRIQNGEFKSITDLKRVFGIGEKTIAINKTDILFSNSQTITSNATKTGRHHLRSRGRHGHTHNRLEN